MPSNINAKIASLKKKLKMVPMLDNPTKKPFTIKALITPNNRRKR